MFYLHFIESKSIFQFFQLLDVVYQEETLKNVIKSVTRNGRSIILTAVLALILVYLFSIIGYLFFRDDFLMQVDSRDADCLPGLLVLNINFICRALSLIILLDKYQKD